MAKEGKRGIGRTVLIVLVALVVIGGVGSMMGGGSGTGTTGTGDSADAAAGTDQAAPEEQPAEETGSATLLPLEGGSASDTMPDSAGPETLPDPFASLSGEEPSRSRRLSLSLRASNLASGSTSSAGYSGMYGSAVKPSSEAGSPS